MKLQDLVLSRELAEKLVELGVELNTWFWWWKSPDGQTYFPSDYEQQEYKDYDIRICPAPTTDELLAVMPRELKFEKYWDNGNDRTYDLILHTDTNPFKETIYCCGYYDFSDEDFFTEIGDQYVDTMDAKKPVDAVGKTLIWLIENGYYEVKK